MSFARVVTGFLLMTCCWGIALAQQRSTYVLVHGAWGGAWQFKNTAEQLTAKGHRVYRVSLTGLGERYHLVNAEVTLSTHINDVVNTILFEQLDDIILMGHSYGGMVITGVADSLGARIRKMVYLDAFVPENGESVASLVQDSAKDLEMLSTVNNEGFVVPFWVKDTRIFPRDVPHPTQTIQDRIVLRSASRLAIPTTYILTFEGQPEEDTFYPFSRRASEYGWKVRMLEADHNPQSSKLEELVVLLDKES